MNRPKEIDFDLRFTTTPLDELDARAKPMGLRVMVREGVQLYTIKLGDTELYSEDYLNTASFLTGYAKGMQS